MQRSESPTPAKVPSPVRPRPKPRPRKRAQDTPMDVDRPEPEPEPEIEAEEPLPTWRRRRSVTISSPVRSSASPAANSGSARDPSPAVNQGGVPGEDDDPFGAQWNNYTLYNDEFARAQSPYVPVPTQDDPGASSEAQEPPQTPSEPNDVIDLTSGSERSRSPSPSDSGSEESFVVEDRKDRENKKALGHMMPTVLQRKLEEQEAKKAREKERKAREMVAARKAGANENQPLRPGESRKRMRAVSNRDIQIVGDSESDVDMGEPGPEPEPKSSPNDLGANALDFTAPASSDDIGLLSSDSEVSVIEPIGHQPRPKYRPRRADSVGGDSDDGSSGSGSADESDGPSTSAPRRPRRNHFRYDGEAEVDNRIDRMLSRTNYSDADVKPKKKKKQKRKNAMANGDREEGESLEHARAGHRNGGGGGGGGGTRGDRTSKSSAGPLRITTSGARRLGSGKQTLLPFKPVTNQDSDGNVEMDGMCIGLALFHTSSNFVCDRSATPSLQRCPIHWG